jgi:ComF family protein
MSLPGFFDKIFDGALSLAYPTNCDVCGGIADERASGVACESCWSKMPLYNEADRMCSRCGLVSEPRTRAAHDMIWSCGLCADSAFDTARSCGPYEGALRATVLKLKRDPVICRRLGTLLLDAITRTPLERATLYVPVPLHADRLAERGFNQAELIASYFSRATGVPTATRVLVREKHFIRHRSGMDAIERRKSVQGAFRVSQPRLVESQRVLLVDDVFTSGATASACALILKESGAAEVFVLTIARTTFRAAIPV